MNILYIGPYRQIDYIGQVSNAHIGSILRHIKPSDKLITRPVYIDTSLVKNDEKTINESITCEKIDIIIQYLPIDFIAIKTDVKNIAVPIIDPKLNNIAHDNEYKKLNLCNKILVDEEKHKHMLKLCGIKSAIDLYEEKLETDNPQKFNLDLIEKNYKFGFIGHYQNNKLIIQKIIQAFLLASRHQNNITLHLFLRGSDQHKQEIDNYIIKTKEQLMIPSYHNKIYPLFGIWNQQESLIALNSIDCFVSLNDDYRYLLYEKYFTTNKESEQYKFLINRQNVQTIETPVLPITNIYEYKNTLTSVITQDLCSKLLSAQSSQQKNKKTDYSSLGNIICKQVL